MNQPFYLLIEVLGENEDRLHAFLESAEDLIQDGVVPQDEKQFNQLWFFRKGVASAAAEIGHVSYLKTCKNTLS